MESPMQRLSRVVGDTLDILHETDDEDTAQELEAAFGDVYSRSEEYPCGCTYHHEVGGKATLHYCARHGVGVSPLTIAAPTDRGWGVEDFNSSGKLECGCGLVAVGHSYGIKWCHLHAAASDLFDVLKELTANASAFSIVWEGSTPRPADKLWERVRNILDRARCGRKLGLSVRFGVE